VALCGELGNVELLGRQGACRVCAGGGRPRLESAQLSKCQAGPGAGAELVEGRVRGLEHGAGLQVRSGPGETTTVGELDARLVEGPAVGGTDSEGLFEVVACCLVLGGGNPG